MSNAAKLVGVFGGSFDPIHFGHIKPNLELIEECSLDHIRLVPCKVSPEKERVYAATRHRWSMLSTVADNVAQFVADPIEIERSTPSYSYETLRMLRDSGCSKTRFAWILGMDAFLSFPQWYRASEILEIAHLIVLQRPGFFPPASGAAKVLMDKHGCRDVRELASSEAGSIYFAKTRLFDVSSTAIREMIRAGEPVKYLLPGSVWSYIQRNNLYSNEDLEKE